ncbi:MAG: hypothetical protein WCG92_11890 [Hyphomicrobiales bacterium]
MRVGFSRLLVGACLWAAVAPAAHAFTVENKDAAGQYAVPKFDLEEQAKSFRKDGSGGAAGGTGLYETPFAGGKLQLGVTQGPSSGFGSVFAPGLGPDNSSASRQHMNRMLSPPSSLDFDNSVR